MNIPFRDIVSETADSEVQKLTKRKDLAAKGPRFHGLAEVNGQVNICKIYMYTGILERPTRPSKCNTSLAPPEQRHALRGTYLKQALHGHWSIAAKESRCEPGRHLQAFVAHF